MGLFKIKNNLPVLVYAFFWATIIFIVTPVAIPSGSLNQLIKYVLIYLLVFVVLALFIQRAIHYQIPGKAVPDKVRGYWLISGSTLLCAAAWSVYGFIFYPGLISWDFYVQWHEMSGKIPFSDWHPVFHTLTMWLVTRVWYSPAMVSIVQILTMSLLIGMASVRLQRSGVPSWIIVLMVFFYALFPLNGFYSVSLWKDIGYSIAFLWLNILLLDIVFSKGDALARSSMLIQLLLALCCVSMMRHNGLVPAFGSLLVLFIVYFRTRLKSLLVLAVTLVGIIVFFKGPVFTWLEVEVQSKNVLKAHLPILHIGAVLSADGDITKEDGEFLSQILPLPYWKGAYQPRSCMPLIFGKNKDGLHFLNRSFLEDDENYKQLLFTWAKLAIQNPGSIVQYYRYSTELLWRIQVPYRPFVIADEDLVEDDLYSGYKPSKRLSERVGDLGRSLIHLINNHSTGWFLHRGAIYFWLSLFVLGLTFIRSHKLVIILIATPMLMQAMTVATFPLIQDTRFMFPIILVAPLLIVLYFSPLFNRPQEQSLL